MTGEITPPHVECNEGYDSSWEEDFEWVLSKYLPDNFTLKNQMPLCECYRGDFAIVCNATGRVWVIEFDGKKYHDRRRDSSRDERILRMHDEVVSITRVDATTGHCYIDETREKLSELLPECFHRVPPCPHPPKWEIYEDEFTAAVFDERYDGDQWYDGEKEEWMPGTPWVQLRITHRTKP